MLFAIEQDSELASELFWKMRNYWYARGPHREGQDWFKRLLATPKAQGRTMYRARALDGAAFLASFSDKHLEARELYDECLEIYLEQEDTFDTCEALGYSGYLRFDLGDYETATFIADQWSARASKLEYNISGPLFLKALIAHAHGEFDTATRLCHNSIQEIQKVEFEADSVRMWHGLLMAKAGDIFEGKALIEKSLMSARHKHHQTDEIRGLIFLSLVTSMQEDIDQAHQRVRDALSLQLSTGIGAFKQLALRQAGQIEATSRRMERAVTLFSAAYSLIETTGQAIHPAQREEDNSYLSALRGCLAHQFDVAWMAGRAMTWEQAAAYALEET